MTANWATIYAEYQQALLWLESLITDPRGERYLIPQTQWEIRHNQEAQLARMERFLAYLGDPQNAYHTVHIAGTGGKGSVATMIDAILRASGVKSGLHTSPYLQVPNEKLVAGGKMITPSGFVRLVEQFRPLYEGYVRNNPDDRPKYGEAWVALTHIFFQQAGVDWAVLETGMGGRFDPTNVVPSSVAVITNVDFDHVPLLGTTLPEIAWHKAGIIKPSKSVVVGETKREALAVIEAEAGAKGAPLLAIGRDFAAEGIRHTEHGVTASIRTPYGRLDDLSVNLSGEYQATNAAIAVTTAYLLREKYSLPITEEAVRTGLDRLTIPGRMEEMQTAPLVIIDGAHNPQKMRAAASALRQGYPNTKKTLVIGMLKTKDAQASLKEIVPLAERVVATEPAVVGKPSFAAAEIAGMIHALRPGIEIEVEPDVQVAVRGAIQRAREGELVFITGSIYMLGQARELWRPKEQMLRALELGAG